MADEMSFVELQQILSFCLDEIEKLRQENDALRGQMDRVTQAVLQLAGKHKELLDDYEDTKKNIATSLKIQDKGLENIAYEVRDPNRDDSSFFYPTFYEMEETLQRIVDDRCSMARFGDGELSIMAHQNRQKFQEYTPELAKRLTDVIGVEDEGFLVAIANNYGALTQYSRAGKSGIRTYMSEQVRKEHRQFLNLNRKYHNAYISRPYVLFADNETANPGIRFKQLKKIWNERNVVIVEGTLSRLGVGNDLFDNAADIQRVEAPPENAFRKYDEILKAALACGKSDSLYLIALGPMAGVLAYDLYCKGYQALDIGHVDLEYEWYLKGEGRRCEVKNKYNNEYTGGEIVEDVQDEKYRAQIVKVVC